MKYSNFLILVLCFNPIYLIGQHNYKVIDRATVASNRKEVKINKGINAGVSLGFNKVLDPLHEARLSPIDNKVTITSIPKSAFLISTALAIPLCKDKPRTIYFKEINETGNETGPVYFIPLGLYIIATVNLLSFNDASDGGIFNQKIDGGLGLGYRFNEDILISGTFEMQSLRQPRDFLLDEFKGKEIIINGQTLTSLDFNNDDYFMNKYMPALSVKFLYLIQPL